MRATFFSVMYIWVQLQTLVQGLNSESTTKNETQDPSRRIFFGRAGAESDFPYVVRLQVGENDGLCGGSIIANQWILSAAHCIVGMNCNGIVIRAAVWEHERMVNPIECHTHPQFDANILTYDTGLLKVQENLVEDGKAQIIPLPDPGTKYAEGTPAITAGWGRTEKEFRSSQLLFGNVKVKDWEPCNAIVRGRTCNGSPQCTYPGIPKRTVCIGGEGSQSTSICEGDSGGPLVIDGKLAGTATSGQVDDDGKCFDGALAMFTSVVDYLPWILSFVSPDIDTSGYEVKPED